MGYVKSWDQQESIEKDEEQAKRFLTWIQNAISSGQLKDPGKPV